MTQTFTIERMDHRGHGVSAEGVAVPYVLPGEIVEAAPHREDARARLIAVTTPSPQRIAPFCAYFTICGGCAIQHWDAEHYRAWKRNLVVEALAKAGVSATVEALIDAHGAGRRRAVFHAGLQGGAVGFMAAGSHDIIDIAQCPVLAPAMSGALGAAHAIAQALTPLRKPLDIQITAASNGLDVDVRGSGALNAKATARLADVAAAHKLVRITRHGELVTQREAPLHEIGKARAPLPPGAFLQATQEGEDVLARLVVEALRKSKHAADLFCGIGPFALRLAQTMKVTAFDNDKAALAALTQGARAPGLKPLSVQPRDLFKTPVSAHELGAYDAVVFDPPRAGADKQAHEIAKSKVRRVAAVSCNAGTFARDARILMDGGFTLERVTPVDQFRHTAHVEVVGVFGR